MTANWYRVPDEKLRPGDIFRLAPALRALKPPLVSVGNRADKSGRHFAELHGLP